MLCADFVKNSFKSSGNINFADHLCLLRFSSNSTRDSNDFSRRLVSRYSDMWLCPTCYSTGSSLYLVNCQLAWLSFLTLCVHVLLTWHTCGLLQLYVMVCNAITTLFPCARGKVVVVIYSCENKNHLSTWATRNHNQIWQKLASTIIINSAFLLSTPINSVHLMHTACMLCAFCSYLA